MASWGENQRGLPGGGGLGDGKMWRERSGLKQMVTGLEGILSVSLNFSFSPSLFSVSIFLSPLFYFLFLCLFVSPLSASISYA